MTQPSQLRRLADDIDRLCRMRAFAESNNEGNVIRWLTVTSSHGVAVNGHVDIMDGIAKIVSERYIQLRDEAIERQRQLVDAQKQELWPP